LKAKDGKIDARFWDERRGKVFSRKGGWIMGKGIFCHGYEMMEELVGEVSYSQLLVLNATGVLPEKRFAEWVDASIICMNWPDPRIWCNQVGALGGTMRLSPVAAAAAGTLTAVSRTYGPKTVYESIQFIQKALEKTKKGMTPAEIVDWECKKRGGKPHIVGFARPIAKGDERVEKMEKVTARLGFSIGEHLALTYEIEKILMEKFNEGMNFTGYAAAFLADQGFSAQEIYQICATLVSSGVTACYVDTLNRPPESFLPMRCDDMDYQGQPSRPVPEE